jgi:hypothetical protein
MNPFSFLKKKTEPGDGFLINSPNSENEIVELVKSYEWVRNTLATEYGCARPEYDPFLLSALFKSNGYHSACIYTKRAVTVGQGYDCSDALKAKIEEANEDQSLQDILDKFSLDLETYGTAFIEPVVDPSRGTCYLYNAPSIVTRIRPADDSIAGSETSYIQFSYKKGYGVYTRAFDKFKPGDRTGIRHQSLESEGVDSIYGQPEYISVQKILNLNFSIVTLAEQWFNNALVLDKLFVLEGGVKFTPEQKNSLQGFMKRTLKGLQNAHKSLILELQRGSKLTVQDMNGSLKEAPYMELRRENRDEIAAAHRVPPRMVGVIPSGQLGSTGEVEGQLKMFKINFADGRQRKIESFFRRLFHDCNLPDWQTFRLKAMDITAGSIDAQMLSMLTGGQPILTPEEAREDWFTEKGHFTPKGASHFIQMAKVFAKGSHLL